MSASFENLLRGALGMFFLIFICWIFSNNRRGINWKLVLIGVVAQSSFALGVLKVNFIKVIFGWVSEKFVELINIGHKGIEFIFGNDGGVISLYHLENNRWKFVGNLSRWAY